LTVLALGFTNTAGEEGGVAMPAYLLEPVSRTVILVFVFSVMGRLAARSLLIAGGLPLAAGTLDTTGFPFGLSRKDVGSLLFEKRVIHSHRIRLMNVLSVRRKRMPTLANLFPFVHVLPFRPAESSNTSPARRTCWHLQGQDPQSNRGGL
jgi:hypothetical protein